MRPRLTPKLTLGPLLFNWPAETVAEFYGRIAGLAPIDTVCLGEVVCAKREPLLGDAMADAAGALADAGKEIVWSSYGLIADDKELAATRDLAESCGGLVEANDITALPLLQGRPHAIGPLVNVYNEGTLQWLVARGATRICLAPELPREAIARLAESAGDAELEIQVFGRMGCTRTAVSLSVIAIPTAWRSTRWMASISWRSTASRRYRMRSSS